MFMRICPNNTQTIILKHVKNHENFIENLSQMSPNSLKSLLKQETEKSTFFFEFYDFRGVGFCEKTLNTLWENGIGILKSNIKNP